MIRWICKKCNRKWIYPVDKCVYCMKEGKIEKQVSKSFKVIGSSKVSIPSKSHPIVPYYALILEDEHGNRMPKKSMKAYNVGDDFNYESGDVAVIKHKYDVYEAIKLAVELVGGIEVNKTTKILIKPTVVAPAYSYLAFNTDPRVLGAVIKYLIEQGASKENILVAEQPPLMDVESAGKKSGLVAACKALGVQLTTLKSFTEKNGYELSNELQRDLIVNLPLMKLDSRFGMSGAVENMTRCLSPKSQTQFYEKGMPVNEISLPKQIIIADCLLGMQGNGPILGDPGYFNFIMAGKDAVSVDETFCQIVMIDTPEYIAKAEGNHNPKIAGSDLYSDKILVEKPTPGATPNSDIRIVGNSPDAKKYYALIGVLGKLASLRGKKMTIVMGKHFNKKDIEGLTISYGATSELERQGIKIDGEISEDPAEQLIHLKKLFGGGEVGIMDKAKAAVLKTAMKFK